MLEFRDLEMEIVDRLRLVRGNMSQAEFAKQLGVHKNTLSRYEQGKSNPDIVFCSKLCTTFSVSPQWLVLGVGEMLTGVASREDPLPPSSSSSHGMGMLKCPRCANLEIKLEKVEAQRDDLIEENRQLYRDKLQFAEENGKLRVAVARMEEGKKSENSIPGPPSNKSVA